MEPSPGDLAERIWRTRRQLRTTLHQRDTLSVLVRDALAQPDPALIAGTLMPRLAEWIPASGWAVVVLDGHGQLTLVGVQGMPEASTPALFGIGAWVVGQVVPLFSADLSRDPRVKDGPPVSVVAFPLIITGRAIGAVIGADSGPSRRAPRFGAGIADLIGEVLETAAVAFEHAFRLQRAEALSVTDDLTGLYNARFLREALHREAKRAVRYGRTVSVLFIDLDEFKHVNDTHGHLAGSRTLVEAGEVIRSCARESDIVARYGGDEFVVVLPDTDSEGALVVGRRVRDRIALHSFLERDGIDCRLTASVGIATLPDAARSAEELLDASDRAMYHVKETGKNNICLASHP